MLYHLFTTFADAVGPFRVFRYPSFRVPGATLTALVLSLWLFPRFIAWLRFKQHGVSNVREDTPEQHQKKRGTPTMGGLFILLAVVVSTFLWSDLANVHVWAVMVMTVGFGAIGFIDDYRKVRYRDSKGLAGRKKLLLQFVVFSLMVVLIAGSHHGSVMEGLQAVDTRLSIPFIPVKWFHPDIGWFYLPFAFLVIAGTSHGLNLTDGLDGLAIGPTIVSSLAFLVLSYAGGLVLTFYTKGMWVDFNVAQYLNMPYVEGIGELAVICGAMVGAGVGFLWYNTFPASVFMGDVGSLALGGTLGAIAVLTKNEILSALVHGVFLAEAVSVILQVASFKMTGKRIFKMAPLHHHFELLGWPEPKIIVRFWIISVILALSAIATVKLR